MLLSNGGKGGNSILFWDLTDNNAPILTLDGHTAEINSISVSPDGKSLASGDMDGKIILWDISNHYFPTHLGTPLVLEENLFGNTPSNNQMIGYLQFSSDGQYIIGKDVQNNVIAWNVQTGQKAESGNFLLSSNQESVVTSSVNKIQVATEQDGITFIDTETNLALGVLPVRAHYLAISPDENYVISYGYLTHAYIGEYPYLWNISIGSWINQACKISNRNLTTTEWNTYLPEILYQETCVNP